ncbi:MAG: recombinase family protein [Rhodospirillales bacterium]|nr:recombinase family protein [Rhodospirillales bacterium]MDP6772682.1 recombinase family protein [Rhodospirillales bacterium]
MLVGYARVSTTDQKMDLQIDALVNAGVEEKRIFQEHVTGVKTARPELDICLRTLREGDVLVVYKLDRLGRSLKELIAIVEQLDRDGIGFKSLTENIDTTTSSGRFFFHLFGAVAQFERDLNSERTKAGLKAARARGRVGGRKPKLTEKKARMGANLLDGDPDLSHEDVADMLQVSRATLYRAWKRYDIAPPDPARMAIKPDKDK